MLNSYKDLLVWQKSMDLVIAVYTLTDKYPKTELYGLVSQSRRCAVSIPSNIAEGRRRGTVKDFTYFLLISYASGAELETQIELAKRLNFTKGADFYAAERLLNEVMRMLNVIINKFKTGGTGS